MPYTDNCHSDDMQWFVMRDLKRSNAKQPAYVMLQDVGVEVFTPMVWKLCEKQGRRIRVKVPFMQSLLVAHTSRKELDSIVERTPTLQYRYIRDGHRSPMTVGDDEMRRFIRAVEQSASPCFFAPEEITAEMVGKCVRIVGGPLHGYEGRLQKLQGSKVKRIFVELSHLLTAAVEVEPEYIEIVKR